jgi:hypothetical protein
VVNSWRVILATMVIFGAGVVTGGLLVQHSDSGRARQAVVEPTSGAQPGPPRTAPYILAYSSRLDFLRRLQRDLDLTPEQGDRIDKLLRQSQVNIVESWQWAEADTGDVLQWTKDEFRKVLTPVQQARFDELLKRPTRPRDPHRQSGPAERAPTNSPVPAKK